MTTHSGDLRQRILNYALLHPVRETAERFQASPTAVQSLEQLYYETGSIAPRQRNTAPDRLISPEGELCGCRRSSRKRQTCRWPSYA